ncbi:PKS-NRPS hybrid synthetase [Sesbania bispinosa]|nr:PKS-NRPS hybrid synthetase [Sesbania bispinosa]
MGTDAPVRINLRTIVSGEFDGCLCPYWVIEGSCWDNIYEEFRAEYAYENDVEIFDNRDELLKWVRETAMTHGFVVVIVRSDAGGNGRKTTLVLGCERSGKVAENLEGHVYAGRLNVDELSLVNDMTKNMVKPRNILLTLKEHNKDNVLCQFHIAKNVKAKFRTYVSHTQEWQPIMDTWMSLMHSSTESDFEMQLVYFEQMVESAHSRLKNLLQDSQGDLCNCWDAMNNMITLQHTEIKASFQRSIMVVEHRFNNPLYNELRGLVSRNALALIDDENQRINYVGIDSSACGCTLRNTHGLPCACQLARYVCMGYQLPITEVHTHWMKLTFNDGGINGPVCGLSTQPECDEVLRRFEELDLSGKVVLKSKMREVAFLETTTMCPPPDKVKTKGGVKGKFKSKYSTKRDPSFFEHVDAMHSQHESCSTQPPGFQSQPRCKKQVTILDQLPSVLHPFIVVQRETHMTSTKRYPEDLPHKQPVAAFPLWVLGHPDA